MLRRAAVAAFALLAVGSGAAGASYTVTVPVCVDGVCRPSVTVVGVSRQFVCGDICTQVPLPDDRGELGVCVRPDAGAAPVCAVVPFGVTG